MENIKNNVVVGIINQHNCLVEFQNFLKRSTNEIPEEILPNIWKWIQNLNHAVEVGVQDSL